MEVGGRRCGGKNVLRVRRGLLRWLCAKGVGNRFGQGSVNTLGVAAEGGQVSLDGGGVAAHQGPGEAFKAAGPGGLGQRRLGQREKGFFYGISGKPSARHFAAGETEKGVHHGPGKSRGSMVKGPVQVRANHGDHA